MIHQRHFACFYEDDTQTDARDQEMIEQSNLDRDEITLVDFFLNDSISTEEKLSRMFKKISNKCDFLLEKIRMKKLK